VAHLAGSMRVPTWILLPMSAEWRWLQDRTDTPWYKSATLWRARRPGDWQELIGRVRNELVGVADRAKAVRELGVFSAQGDRLSVFHEQAAARALASRADHSPTVA